VTRDDVNEAIGVLQAGLGALQAGVPGQAGRQGASFRYACGDLLAQAVSLLQASALGTPLRSCFDQAVAAGVTLNGLVAVRNAVLAPTLVGQPAIAAAGACYCLALGAEASVLADATFTSSSDALTALSVFTAAVGVAQDWALDNHLSAQYQALLSLGATVARDMQTRAAQLPRLVTYGFPRGASSLVMAYRLYGDAGRADELRAENHVNHPAFMPATGTALSE
jgi:hypothetical protein